MVWHLADQAVIAAKATGREQEVDGAFELLSHLPINFAGKEQISSVMLQGS
jgi:hypothetical protein